MTCRLDKILDRLKRKGLDALLVTSPANISYLLDFRSRDSYLLLSPQGNVYFTDSRYTHEVAKLLKGKAELCPCDGELFKRIAQAVLGRNLRSVGFEERNLPYAEFRKIQEMFRKKAKLEGVVGLVEELREVKEQKELLKIKQAIKITREALTYIKGHIKPGRPEIEIAGELERFIRNRGANQAAFDIIVASGPNSAFPHNLPGHRQIRKDEPVLIDIGVDYKGYKSDLTRVFFSGKITGLCLKIYDIVLKAQELALKKIRPGGVISEVDAAARGYIAKMGYGANFGHNLGHGIGLEVHEDPHISPKEGAELLQGEVFTVEPAIYLPGKFGIRIEDMVLVTKKGCEVLSGFP